MIAFYIQSSDSAGRETLREILWADNGFETRIRNSFTPEQYGTELRRILIGFYVEGEIPVDAPPTPRVGRVSRKDKSLRIDIALDGKSLKSSDLNSIRAYVIRKMTAGIRAPIARRKWDFDFEKLATDLDRLLNRRIT